MKSISFTILAILTFKSLTSSALDLDSFHGSNLNPIGSGCGIHLEVSKSTLIVTDIIPPRNEQESLLCSPDRFLNCDGSSVLLKCDKTGKCIKPGHVFQLLEDGNVVSVLQNKKYAYANSETYYFCTNN